MGCGVADLTHHLRCYRLGHRLLLGCLLSCCCLLLRDDQVPGVERQSGGAAARIGPEVDDVAELVSGEFCQAAHELVETLEIVTSAQCFQAGDDREFHDL